MPSCLLMARDGSTVVTGHVDGTVCLWDARAGARGGSGMAGPVLEAKDHTQAICGLACTSSEATLLVVSRDNTVCLWDFRVMVGW
jgi:WD40 repeat protein